MHDTFCISAFQNTPNRPVIRRTDWANFQSHEDGITFNPKLHKEMAIHTWVENPSSAVLKALPPSTPMCPTRDDAWPPIPTGNHDDVHLKKRLRGQWQVFRGPSLTAEFCRSQWSAGLTSAETTSSVRNSNPLIPKTKRYGGKPNGRWEISSTRQTHTSWLSMNLHKEQTVRKQT